MVGLTALSSKSGRPISTFLNFMFHPVVLYSEVLNIIFIFVHNSLLFPAVKEFSKSVSSW